MGLFAATSPAPLSLRSKFTSAKENVKCKIGTRNCFTSCAFAVPSAGLEQATRGLREGRFVLPHKAAA